MEPLVVLADHLDELARSPRARPWFLRYQLGMSTRATERVYVVLAPPSGLDAVLARLHNGILLLHPAGVSLQGPLPVDRLDAALAPLSTLHEIPIRSGPPVGRAAPRLSVPAVAPQADRAPTSGTALGLDVGGTGMKACLLDGDRVIASAVAPTWPDATHGLDSLVTRARDLLAGLLTDEAAGSLGIGFASPMGVDGRVHGLSTVMRERLGSPSGLDTFGERVGAGLVTGPVVVYNDLAVLGRDLSAGGARRLLRLQIGTSFGGCWIDADGTVNTSELGRMRVDVAEGARSHTYLPLTGAMKAYLSTYGVAWSLTTHLGRTVSSEEAGYVLADLLGEAAGRQTIAEMADLLVGVVREAKIALPGLRTVQLGGGMVRGATGARIQRAVRERLERFETAPTFQVARDPGLDGAVAAARAPRAAVRLRGWRRAALNG